MTSTFFGIEIGRRALAAHTSTQNVIGHNIANASTPGYSRQESIIQTTAPIYAPFLNRSDEPGQYGTGNEMVSVMRYRDVFLDSQIRNGNDVLGKQEVVYDSLRQVEDIFNEPSEDSLNQAFSLFWSSWQELTKHPESVAVRTNVMEVAVSLTDVAHKINFELRQLQSDYDTAIRQEIINVNIKASEIRSINEKIAKIDDLDDEANDLKDRRDLLIDELSLLIDMNYFETDRDQVAVIVGNSTLVRDDYYFGWYDSPKNEYATAAATRNEKTAIFSDIISEEHDLKVNVSGGKIGGYIYARDVIIPGVLDMFDELIESFIYQINAVHTRGYGLDESTDTRFFLDEIVQIPHTGVLNPTWNITYVGENQLPSGTRTSRKLTDLGVTIVPGVNDEIHINGNVITLDINDTLEDALEKIQDQAALNAWYDIEAGRVFFSSIDTVRPDEEADFESASPGVGSTAAASPTEFVDIVNNPFSEEDVGGWLVVNQGTPTEARYQITDFTDAGHIEIGAADFGNAANIEYQIIRAPIQMNVTGNSSNFLDVMGFFEEDPLQADVYYRTSLPTFTSYHNSDTTSRLEVNPALIDNVNKIAAAADLMSLPGDNQIALQIADLENQLTMSGRLDFTATVRHTATFQEYFNSLISKIGVDAQSADRAYRNQELILEEYEKRRTEAIGVSIDEELTKMIQAQKSFNSASRMITTVDEMLDRIINNMGLVGR